jgi:Membrane-associating domain
LALSVTLVKGQIEGSVPSILGFSAFLGALGMIVGFLGVAVLFFEPLQCKPIAIWVVDGVLALFFAAGGIALAVELKGVDCNNWVAIMSNKVLNCGAQVSTIAGQQTFSSVCVKGLGLGGSLLQLEEAAGPVLHKRCMEARADNVFVWLGFLASLGCLGLGIQFLRTPVRKGFGYMP